MKQSNVRLTETFLGDMLDIMFYILEKSGNPNVSRRFYNEVLSVIDDRSFSADSYESYHPYPGSPEYRRIYFGNYTIFYVIVDNWMDVRRILWSGVEDSKKL